MARNRIREIQQINERELVAGITDSASWHQEYASSAYVFVGGLPFELTEGDIIAVFSQFGEVVDCNLIRDKESGKSRGFAYVAFEDQRSTVLAVDNMNGALVLGRLLHVDHVRRYRKPKHLTLADAKSSTNAFGDVLEDDDVYEERRKRIWDYEKYAAEEMHHELTATGDDSLSTHRPVGDLKMDEAIVIPKATKKKKKSKESKAAAKLERRVAAALSRRKDRDTTRVGSDLSLEKRIVQRKLRRERQRAVQKQLERSGVKDSVSRSQRIFSSAPKGELAKSVLSQGVDFAQKQTKNASDMEQMKEDLQRLKEVQKTEKRRAERRQCEAEEKERIERQKAKRRLHKTQYLDSDLKSIFRLEKLKKKKRKERKKRKRRAETSAMSADTSPRTKKRRQ